MTTVSQSSDNIVFEINRTKPDVIIATPGRLMDLVQNWNLDLSEVKIQILDEGDLMLDMGFSQDIETLQKAMPLS
jgi:ATP-dependent RNA helicase DeaD